MKYPALYDIISRIALANDNIIPIDIMATMREDAVQACVLFMACFQRLDIDNYASLLEFVKQEIVSHNLDPYKLFRPLFAPSVPQPLPPIDHDVDSLKNIMDMWFPDLTEEGIEPNPGPNYADSLSTFTQPPFQPPLAPLPLPFIAAPTFFQVILFALRACTPW